MRTRNLPPRSPGPRRQPRGLRRQTSGRDRKLWPSRHRMAKTFSVGSGRPPPLLPCRKAECRTQPEPRAPQHQGPQRSHPASVRPHCPELLPPPPARNPSAVDCSPPDRGLRFPEPVRGRHTFRECFRRRRCARPGSGQTQPRRPAWVLANWNSKPFLRTF